MVVPEMSGVLFLIVRSDLDSFLFSFLRMSPFLYQKFPSIRYKITKRLIITNSYVLLLDYNSSEFGRLFLFRDSRD